MSFSLCYGTILWVINILFELMWEGGEHKVNSLTSLSKEVINSAETKLLIVLPGIQPGTLRFEGKYLTN